MVSKAGGVEGQSVHPGKYAHVERERRFLLARAPSLSTVTVSRLITDRYLVGTRLRLRRADFSDGRCEMKLTQKVPASLPGATQGLITNTYLSRAEYDLLASLPARVLSKARLSVPPLGVDVFDAHLQGLVLAEVTDDARFTGGRLVQTSRQELLEWLAEYGLRPE